MSDTLEVSQSDKSWSKASVWANTRCISVTLDVDHCFVNYVRERCLYAWCKFWYVNGEILRTYLAHISIEQYSLPKHVTHAYHIARVPR